MTSTEARQYEVGAMYPVDEVYVRRAEWCEARNGGFICTLREDHEGQHVGGMSTGEIGHVWDRPEPIVEEPTERTELDRFRQQVRSTAERKLRDGYGETRTWNRFLVHVGLEPITTRTVRIVAPVRTAIRTFSSDTTEQEAADYLAARRGNIGDFLAVDTSTLDADAATVEVVTDVPGVEGEDPDWRADTADLDTYKALVLEEARELQSHHSWCDEGTDQVLREVGLPVSRPYRVQVSVTARQTVYVTVDAADEDTARDMVEMSDVSARVDRYGWNWDSEDWEIDEVEED